MKAYDLRPLTKIEPVRHLTPPRKPSVQRVPRPDHQLTLDLPLPAGRARPPVRLRPVPEPLDQHQVRKLVTTILEACDGRRPAAQVRPYLDPSLYDRLLDPGARARCRYLAKSVHVCRPADGVIEACATVECGIGFVALAARFERPPSGWRCTRFHLLEPQAPRLRLTA